MITLTRTISDNQQDGLSTGWWLKVVVQTDADEDTNMLIHQLSTVPGIPDTFTGVAGAFDMDKMPTVRPQPCGGGIIPFYRTSQMEIWCYSPGDRERVWTTLQEEVQRLVNDLAINPSSESVNILPQNLPS